MKFLLGRVTDRSVMPDLPRPPLCVLVVEDRPAIANAVARGLRGFGHAVSVSHSASEAALLQGSFDVGIFDLALDDGDGVVLAERMRHAGQVKTMVFFSGSVEEPVLARAGRMAPVVGKGASLADLNEALYRANAGRGPHVASALVPDGIGR